MDWNNVWRPKVLSEYEIGRSMSAIDAVTLLGKPIVEVFSRTAEIADLESDLKGCIELAGKTDLVLFWIRPCRRPRRALPVGGNRGCVRVLRRRARCRPRLF